jgi:outer membrane protein OmpA-like peptidoglycan-associated protein
MKLLHVALLAALVTPIAASTAHAEIRTTTKSEKKQAVTRVKSFDYGQLYVHTPERHELFRVAQLWRQRPAWWTITIEGHGFVANNEEASIELGAKRAERVRDLLVKFGVDARFIKTVGHSRSEPGRYVDVLVESCAACKR